MLNKTDMKRWLVVFSLSITAFLMLFTVGLATYVITRPVDDSVASGKINVDDAVDSSYSVKHEWVKENGENLGEGIEPVIAFGSVSEVLPNEWLSFEGEKESLTAYLKLTVTNSDHMDNNSVISISFAPSNDEKFNSAINDGYISAPYISKTSVTKEDLNDKGEIIITFKFGWGSKFEFKNPYLFYNSQEFDSDLAGDAVDSLHNLYAYLNGITYKVTING